MSRVVRLTEGLTDFSHVGYNMLAGSPGGKIYVLFPINSS